MVEPASQVNVPTLVQAAKRQEGDALGRLLGLYRNYLRLLARGAGGTTVTADPWIPRSRSHETTFEHDLTDRAEIAGQVSAMATTLAREAAGEGRPVARVGVKVRFVPFFTRIRSMTLAAPTNDAGEIERAALTVLDRFEETGPVRLLGVRVEFEQPPPDDG